MPNTKYTPDLQRYLRQENKKLVDTLKTNITNREVRDEDYPKVSIACEYGQHKAYGHSLKCHSSIKKSVKYVKPLYQALGAYGTPPEVKRNLATGKVTYIGTCAEDSAANQVMMANNVSIGHYPRMKDLVFTEPVRVRNYQRRKFCDVCKAIF